MQVAAPRRREQQTCTLRKQCVCGQGRKRTKASAQAESPWVQWHQLRAAQALIDKIQVGSMRPVSRVRNKAGRYFMLVRPRCSVAITAPTPDIDSTRLLLRSVCSERRQSLNIVFLVKHPRSSSLLSSLLLSSDMVVRRTPFVVCRMSHVAHHTLCFLGGVRRRGRSTLFNIVEHG